MALSIAGIIAILHGVRIGYNLPKDSDVHLDIPVVHVEAQPQIETSLEYENMDYIIPLTDQHSDFFKFLDLLDKIA